MLLLLALFGFSLANQAPDNGYFLWRHSFLPPFGIGTLPHWDAYGSTLINDDYVSLTPNEKDTKGQLWNREAITWKNWEVQIRFVVGRDKHYGADGFAFWYTKEKRGEGSAFGNSPLWKGLAVMFDTYDNDGTGSHPAIYAVHSDGTKEFDHSNDGSDMQFAHCLSNFRTTSYDQMKPHRTPNQVNIRYLNGLLSLNIQIGHEWMNCFERRIQLERGGYFGLSAATGGVTDHHDIVSFTAYSFPEEPQQEDPKQQEVKQHKELPTTFDVHVQTDPQEQNAELPPSLGVQAFMNDVANRQVQFSVALSAKFVSFASKLSDMDHQTSQSLASTSEAISSLTDRLVASKEILETLKQDIKLLDSIVSELTENLKKIQSVAEEVALSTETHFREVLASRQKSEEALQGHSTGFWIFFVLFQIFFIGNMLYSKKTTDAKKRLFD